jgi:hypothetical protein
MPKAEFDVGIKLYVCVLSWIGFSYFEYRRAVFLGRAIAKGYSEKYFCILEAVLGALVLGATYLAGKAVMNYEKPVKKRSKFEKVPAKETSKEDKKVQ